MSLQWVNVSTGSLALTNSLTHYLSKTTVDGKGKFFFNEEMMLVIFLLTNSLTQYLTFVPTDEAKEKLSSSSMDKFLLGVHVN